MLLYIEQTCLSDNLVTYRVRVRVRVVDNKVIGENRLL